MILDYFIGCGWSAYVIPDEKFKGEYAKKAIKGKPIAFIIEKSKGNGIDEMIDDPVEWNYKKFLSKRMRVFSLGAVRPP